MKPNFSEETKREVLEENNYLCQYCKVKPVFDFHHRLSNTKYNQKKFPKFLQSKKNCKGLCRDCHTSGKVKKLYKINDEEARKMERRMCVRDK